MLRVLGDRPHGQELPLRETAEGEQDLETTASGGASSGASARARGLVDSGTTRTIVGPKFTLKKKFYSPGISDFIVGFDGVRVQTQGESVVELQLAGRTTVVPVVHSRSILEEVDLIIGMDVLRHYKITIDGGKAPVVAAAAESEHVCSERHLDPFVEGPNFRARFWNGAWEAEWDWEQEPELSRRIRQYAVALDLKPEFDRGVGKWITNGWLKEWKQPGNGPAVPLMAVLQEAKKKVRPVLDYREVNEFVNASGAKADVCTDGRENEGMADVPSKQLDSRYQRRIYADPGRSKVQQAPDSAIWQ